jgi:hypothetical protein
MLHRVALVRTHNPALPFYRSLGTRFVLWPFTNPMRLSPLFTASSILNTILMLLFHLVFLRSVRRLLVTASVVTRSPILVTLMKEELISSETSVLTRSSSVTLRRLSGPRSRPTCAQKKTVSAGNRTRDLWVCSQEFSPVGAVCLDNMSRLAIILTISVSAPRWHYQIDLGCDNAFYFICSMNKI